jgi:hypothetical protein
MTRRSGTLLGVLVVLAALIGAYLLVTRPKPSAPTPALITLSKGDKDKIVRVTLTDRPEGTLTLVKKDGAWSVQPPVTGALEDVAIDNLLYSFSSLNAERVIAEKPTDLAQYGLAPPRATATGTWEDGTSHTIFLGDKAPSGSSFYVQVKGDPRVYTAETYTGEHFHWTVKDLLSRTITPAINYDEVTYVKLSEPDGTVIEVRKKEGGEAKSMQLGFGQYVVMRPYRPPRGLDSQKQDSIIKAAQGVAIADFPDQPLKPLAAYGLDHPRAELITKDKSNTLDLLFGAPKGTQTYFSIRGRPGVYLTDTSGLDFLKTKPFDIIDKFAFIPNIEDVDRIDIRSGGTTHTLVLTRTTKKAPAENPPSSPNASANAAPQETVTTTYTVDGKAAEEDNFKKFYQALIALQVEGETARNVPDAPDLSVTFQLNKGDPRTVKVDYAPYNRDFDAVFVNGVGQFALTKGQLAVMRAKLDQLVSGQKVTD